VVAARDRAVFTLGRLPADDRGRRRATDAADRLDAFLAGRRMPYGEAGRGLGVPPNALRYGTTTGRILLRWDGARQPVVWTVPPPETDPREARLELARRHLHVFGPTTSTAFARWAGVTPAHGRATFDALGPSLVPVRTPIGDGWILAADEAAFRATHPPAATARLLPSGDAFYLLQGADRDLLVPDAARRGELWTSRVWPGAVLVAGEVTGTWRRADAEVTIRPWRGLSAAERDAVAAEAASLPLPGVAGPVAVAWEA
jgi:hypothetical protein